MKLKKLAKRLCVPKRYLRDQPLWTELKSVIQYAEADEGIYYHSTWVKVSPKRWVFKME